MLQNITKYFTKRKSKTQSSESESLDLRISQNSQASVSSNKVPSKELNNTISDAESLKSIVVEHLNNVDPALDASPVFSTQEPCQPRNIVFPTSGKSNRRFKDSWYDKYK